MTLNRIRLSIIRNIQDYGLVVMGGKALKRLLSPLFESYTYRIYCIDPCETPVQGGESGKGLVFRLANSRDVEIIRQIECMAEWLAGKVGPKLDGGHLCIVAMDGAKVAGFNLIALERAHIPLIRLDWGLPEGEAWSEQISVDPAYRRRGVGTALRFEAFRELRKRGVVRFCGGALKSNLKSLKLARRSGYRFSEDITYRKILWFKKWYRKEVIQ